MKKTNTQVNIPAAQSPKQAQPFPKPAAPATSLWAKLLMVLYLMVEIAPVQWAGVIDSMGVQWFYLNIVNLLAAFYLFRLPNSSPRLFRNPLGYAGLGFVCLMLLSVVTAFNRLEWLVSVSRLSVTAVAVINITALLRSHDTMPRFVLRALAASGLLQAAMVIGAFAAGDAAGMMLTLSNRNIVATSLTIKLAITLYLAAGDDGRMRRIACAALFPLMFAICLAGSRLSVVMSVLQAASLIVFVILLNGFGKTVFAAAGLPVAMVAGGLLLGLLCTAAAPVYTQPVAERVVSLIAQEPEGPRPTTFNRLDLWHNALNFAAGHPLLGGGAGNWKIHSIPYEKLQLDDRFLTRRVHNDFLEIAADAGFPASLFFAAIFGVCGLWLVQGLRLRRYHLLQIAPCAAMVVYATDAAVNFPMERANMQMLLAMLLALNLDSYFVYQSTPTGSMRRSSLLPLGAAALSLLAIPVSYMVLRSMQLQHSVRQQLADGDNAGIPDGIPDFPVLPEISEAGTPVAHIRAKYLYEQKKYDEAIAAIRDGWDANPYLPYGDYLMARIFEGRGLADSAFAHYRAAYLLRPLSGNYYILYQEQCAQRRDTAMLCRNFRDYIQHIRSPSAWCKMANWAMLSGMGPAKALAFLDEGALETPGNRKIEFERHNIAAMALIRQGNYEEALIESRNALKVSEEYPALINCGTACLATKRFREGIASFSRAVARGGSVSGGEPQFFRAECYTELGIKDSACADFIAAQKQGYPVNPAFLAGCK